MRQDPWGYNIEHSYDVLKSGKTAIETTSSVDSPTSFLAEVGYDFLLFDTQHSPVEIKELQKPLQAMKGKQATPVIRWGKTDRIRSVTRWTLVPRAS